MTSSREKLLVRKNVLLGRTNKDNSNIIRKIDRLLRKLEKENN